MEVICVPGTSGYDVPGEVWDEEQKLKKRKEKYMNKINEYGKTENRSKIYDPRTLNYNTILVTTKVAQSENNRRNKYGKLNGKQCIYIAWTSRCVT